MNNQKTIDISKENIHGKCDLKCAYTFNYPNTNLTAKNDDIMISLTTDNTQVAPVIYNNEKYIVSKIIIISPSLHLFNGKKVNAEIIVQHDPQNGSGTRLFVCVPIIQSRDSSTATTLLNQIVTSVVTNAPSSNETTNLNLTNFTLDNIIPKKPFFSYNGVQPMNGEFIVFSTEFAIPLNEKTLNSLSKIIKPYLVSMTTDGNLFFNINGPNSNVSNEGIYISCQPTGSSEEEIEIVNSKNAISYDFESITTDPTVQLIFQIIIGCLIFIILFKLLSYIFNSLAKGTIKIPTL